MVERRSLADDPFFSEPILSQRPAGTLEQQVEASQAELPAPPSGREVVQDIGRSALSGLAQGAAGTMIGGAGSVETFLGKDVPEMARSGAAYLGEKMGVVSPEEQRRISEKPIYSGMTPEQERGAAAPFSGLPTYKAVTEQFKPTMKAAGADVLAYEPKTDFGKVASSAMEYGAQGLPGATKGVLGRFATGFGAGAGSEFAGMSSEDPDSAGYNKLMGALAGAGAGAVTSSIAGKLFNGVKALAFSSKVAQDDLVNMISQDIRRGVSPMTPEQFAEAQRRGAQVTALDLAGPETRKRIGAAAERSPGAEDAAAKYNDFLNQRAASSGERVSQSLSNVFGRPVNAPALQEAMEDAGRSIRDNVYTAMKADPAAQSIPLQMIGADLIRRPIIQKAMRDATETAINNPSWGIITPSAQQNGNLAFWDQVKREIDSKLASAKSPINPDQSAVATLTANKADLVNRLDAMVPVYKSTRDIASDTFGAASAPEAGYKFFKNMDAFSRNDAMKAFNKYKPNQKELFAVGFAHNIDELASTPGGLAKLTKRFDDKNFKAVATKVLGRDRFEQIHGTVLSENILSKAKELRFIEQSSGLPSATIAGAALGAGAEAAMAGSMFLTPAMATNMALGAAVGAVGKTFLNAMERKIAAKIVPMATDPAQAAELGKLASRSPAVGQVLNKIVGIMNNKIVTGTSATITSQERPQRASGGRAGGMTADMLIAAAERAKKAIGKDTEALLSTPDASVAKALAVANQKLEG